MALLTQGTAIRVCSLLALACGLSQAQTTYPGAVDTAASLLKASEHAETTLTVAANNTTDTVFTVADATRFEVDNLITFCVGPAVPGIPCTDSGEKARVSAVTATAPGTITVSARNLAGSTAQNHAIGDTVRCAIGAPYHDFLVGAIAATQTKVDTIATGGSSFYQFVQDAGVSATPREKLNLIPDVGITLACVDNSGAGSTDCTFSAPGATGTGTNFQSMYVDGVLQTAAPTVRYVSDAGFLFTGTHDAGTNSEIITGKVTGSGSGTKTAYAAFPAAGCAGSTAGAAIDLPQSGGPAVVCKGTTLRFGTLDFTSATNQFAQIHFPLPGDWTAASTVSLQLNWFSDTGSSSSTSWSAKTFCASSSSTVLTGTITWNTAGTVTTTNNVAPLTRAASTISGIVSTGCSAGLEQWMQIARTDSATGVVSLVSASVAIQRTY